MNALKGMWGVVFLIIFFFFTMQKQSVGVSLLETFQKFIREEWKLVEMNVTRNMVST